MLTQQEKYNTLNRILGSQIFSKSTTAKVLLKFLVESSIQGDDISASDIAREIFGSQYKYDKSEANVRVNIYHLRKKLERYYDEEGTHEINRITIEKGQYKVDFKNSTTISKIKKKKAILAFAFTATVLFFLNVLILSKNKDKVWSNTYKNGHQTTLYLTSVFTYTGPTFDGHRVTYRDTRINSNIQLINFLDTIPGAKELYNASPTNYTYTAFEDAATIKNFTRLFTKHNSEFAVRKSSDFSINDIKEQNIIFLSPMRYKTVFSEVFNELTTNAKLITNNQHQFLLKYSDETGRDTTYSLSFIPKKREYAIAAKFITPTNTCQYMFFADHGMGLSAMAEYFTNDDSLQVFSERYLKNTDEFVSLFLVSGKDRTNLDMKLVLFDDNQ